MKHAAAVLIALALLYLAPAAPDLRAADEAKPAPVVVDPGDFRQPIPDPEQGLFNKYDSKPVIFSGVVGRSNVNKKANTHNAELHFDIVKRTKVKGKETVETEKIIVAVTFLSPELTLQQLVEKEQRTKGPGVHVTVQGVGHISTVDGSLTITEAVIIPDKRNPFNK
jgi:hypothetical protein